MNKQSNFIGQYFKQYIKQTNFDRKLLVKKLNWKYANNDRMICAYFVKKDYLWAQFEVENWCRALSIRQGTPIYDKLLEKAGVKSYGDFK